MGTIGGLTLVSRIFGFARDMLLARILGAGLAADCFQLAFRLPNTFRRLFAEGAFSAAYVPMFSRELQGPGGQADAERFSQDRSEEHTSELKSLMRISYAVFCLQQKTNQDGTTCQTTTCNTH